MKSGMYGYIYKTTFIPTGEFYIGRHKYTEGEDWMHYLGSGKRILLLSNEYTKENFKKALIDTADTFEELMNKESRWISYYNSKDSGKMLNISMSSGGHPAGDTWSNLSKEEYEERRRTHSKAMLNSKKRAKAMKRIIEQNKRQHNELINKNYNKIVELHQVQYMSIKEIEKALEVPRRVVADIFKSAELKSDAIWKRRRKLILLTRSDAKDISKKNLSSVKQSEFKQIKIPNATQVIKYSISNTIEIQSRDMVFMKECKQCKSIIASTDNIAYCSRSCRNTPRVRAKRHIGKYDEDIKRMYTEDMMSTGEISRVIPMTQPGVLSVLKRIGVETRGHGWQSKSELEGVERRSRGAVSRECFVCKQDFDDCRYTRTCSNECRRDFVSYVHSTSGKKEIKQKQEQYSKEDIIKMRAGGMPLAEIAYITWVTHAQLNKILKR